MKENEINEHIENVVIENVVMKDDRSFFENNKDRSYRLRPAYETEIKEFVLKVAFDPTMCTNNKGKDVPMPDDWCWWIAVWQIEPGARYRRGFAAPMDLDPNPTERVAKGVWDLLTKKRKQQ